MAKQLKMLLVACAAAIAVHASADVQVTGRVFDPVRTERYIQVASKVSRYPLPASMPVVVVVPGAWFTKNVCEGAEPCGVLGVFYPMAHDYVILNADMPVDLQETVLVHELVHYLQWANGQMHDTDSCEMRRMQEAEAYAASYRFELENLKFTHGLVSPPECK